MTLVSTMETVTEKYSVTSEQNSDLLAPEAVTLKDDPVKYKQPLIWRNIIILGVYHIFTAYGLIHVIQEAKLLSYLFSWMYACLVIFGVGAGAHRYWSHRSYSAKLPLQILLAVLFSMSGQSRLSQWVRDHRVHHRYTDTPADPHNANRGFFYSHMGWFMRRRHPLSLKYGAKVDMSSIYNDPVVQFFDKHHRIIMPMMGFIVPTIIPVYGWNESWRISFYITCVRHVCTLHISFSINSFAHLWGTRPYNKNILPAEVPIISFFALGECWHNYHHMFPWDYKTAELGNYWFNATAGFIDFMAWLGLAYNLKTAKKKTVEYAYLNKGDGSTSFYGNTYHEH